MVEKEKTEIPRKIMPKEKATAWASSLHPASDSRARNDRRYFLDKATEKEADVDLK